METFHAMLVKVNAKREIQEMTSEYDRFGDFYDNFIHENLRDPRSFHRQTVDVVMELLGDVSELRVCDLACGEGHFSRLLANAGARVTGIDLSADLLARARSRSEGLDINFVLDDAQVLKSVGDSSFDAVACNMALMDMPNLESTYRSVCRVLVPRGLFICSFLHPCFESPYSLKTGGQIEFDCEGNFKALRVMRYTEEGKWFSGGSGMRGTLGSIHRKLSTYVNTLITSGYEICSLHEPTLPRQEYQELAAQWAAEVPRALIVKARKVGRQESV